MVVQGGDDDRARAQERVARLEGQVTVLVTVVGTLVTALFVR